MSKRNIIILAIAATIFGATTITVVGAEQNQINEELANANGIENRYRIIGEERAYEDLTTLIDQQNAELEPKNTEMAGFIEVNKYTIDQALIDEHTPYLINEYYVSVIEENYQATADKLIADLDALYTKNKDLKFSETEKTAFDAAKKEFDALKVLEVTTVEEKMQHITDLQANKTSVDKVLADYNARTKAEKEKADSKKAAEEEAQASGGEVVYDEANGTYEVSYDNGGSSGSGSGSSNGGSSGGSGSGGGSATPPPSNGSGSSCDEIGWGGVDGDECITEDPYTGTITVNSSNEICTWIHGMRSYMGASSVGCSVKAGTKGSAYWVGMEYLPSYEYVSKNTNLFPAMLAEPEEGYQKCYYVEFRDGQVFVDGYQQEE